MPSKNTIRQDVPETYYHVYVRGSNKQPIFLEDSDYTYFIYLLTRYLSTKEHRSNAGVLYPSYHGLVELLVFCIMKNHFHLLIYQKNTGDLSKFMKSIMVSYGRYFNLKYKRTGSIFESRFKAAPISSNEYLLHASRYIHLNPRSWKRYPYSSIQYYRSGVTLDWLSTERVLEQYETKQEYIDFVSDYEENKKMLDELKYELADG